MLLDARSISRDDVIDYDVCIVGAGAAGITLAQELNGSGLRVLLVESGGLRSNKATQDLYAGEVSDPRHHGPLDKYRVRRFGGTTTVWGGWCAPFDASDFLPHPYVPYSGWPIRKPDLDPFYVRAHAYCELGRYDYDVESALPAAPAVSLPPEAARDVVTDKLWLMSRPTDFGRTYLPSLKQSTNVHVCLYGNALELLADPVHHVDRLQVACLQGNRFQVRARVFVLAAGGLETTRLLLVSDGVHRGGIGNAHGHLGRFYMSHLSGDVGELELRRPDGVAAGYEITADGIYCRRRWSVDRRRQEADGLLNFAAILDRPAPADPSHRDGVLSAIYLAKLARGREAPGSLRHVAAHLGNVVGGAGQVLRFSTVWARRSVLGARRLPSAMPPAKGNRYTLHFDAEQSPNPDSRVRLDEDRDAFGLPRLRVDWRFTEIDVESAARSAEVIAQALSRAGIGRAVLGPHEMRARIREMASVGSHHLGTTRMSSDPTEGVVDQQCRVHGTDNLYVASGSVFATSSYARPTLTIVALAIRLADHLRSSALG
jgi:choline dehydrogenase-like flavoprotein